jgi:hypothetical protein
MHGDFPGFGDLFPLEVLLTAVPVVLKGLQWQDQSIFFVDIVVGEPFSGRTDVNVLLSQVAEVLLAKAPSPTSQKPPNPRQSATHNSVLGSVLSEVIRI